MLARRFGGCRCAGGWALRSGRQSFPSRFRLGHRQFASQASQTAAAASSAQIPFSATTPLGALTVELDQIAPRFEIPACQITILDSPAQFYQTLKNKILNAKRRIYLSTLYIGNAEHDLVATIDTALQGNPDLKVSILTDALRGTRESPDPSCASLLADLVRKHGDRVEIRMFHTPNLKGLKKKVVPKRINEGWGLQHMKLYGIDDEIILSGANLSNDYFTNRVDRYHIFSSTQLADYYARIHQSVCNLSFQVLPGSNPAGYVMTWPNAAPCPLTETEAFKSHSAATLKPLIQPAQLPPAGSLQEGSAFVYPISQFTPLIGQHESTEYPAVTSILSSLAESPQLKNSKWLFTAGYFNMHPTVSSLLISSAPPSSQDANICTVLTASPWANGFFGSKGISGMLPAAYTHLATGFLSRVAIANRKDTVQLKEWRRGTVGQPDGWTYHAKGLWVTLPKEVDPSLTIVGSSNYTKRSYNLDIEVGAVVVTSDEKLKRRLGEETRWLQQYASITKREDLEKPERKARWHVRLAMRIVEMVGGAL